MKCSNLRGQDTNSITVSELDRRDPMPPCGYHLHVVPHLCDNAEQRLYLIY